MKNADTRAFTLIEVLTVISILMIIAGFMVRGGSPARDTFLLDQTTNKIADMYRTARQYSISAREYNGTYPSYGVAVRSGTDAANPGLASIYARTDATIDGGNLCSVAAGASTVQTINFSQGIFISSVWVNQIRSPGADAPVDLSGVIADVMFVRPQPTVYIVRSNNPCSVATKYGTSELQVTVRNATGDERLITVNSNGSVNVRVP